MTIDIPIALDSYISRLGDRERIDLVQLLLESIQEEGTIDEIRKRVGDSRFDDQPPMTKSSLSIENPCLVCRGRGVLTRISQTREQDRTGKLVPCPGCGGTGRTPC